jgi:hypothetical protein
MTDMNKINETVDKIEQVIINLDKQKKNQFKLIYALKWQEGYYKQKEFFLPFPKKQGIPKMDEYLKDFQRAFGKLPAWMQDTFSFKGKPRSIDLDSFYGQMKLRWKKNQ